MSTLTLRNRTATAIAVILPYWLVAALLIAAIDFLLDPVSLAVAVVAKVISILLVAFAYMRIGAPEATIDQALFTGIAWGFLTIAVEVFAVTSLHRQWTPLLGSPAHTASRDLLLLVWIGAPALFAR